MKLREHAITGSGGGLLLALSWGTVQGVIFFLASVLIDFDHIIDFLWRSRFRKLKNSSIKYILEKAYKFEVAILSPDHLRKKDILVISAFHTWEFPLFIYLLKVLTGMFGFNLLSTILMSAFWGTAVHLILDAIYNIKLKITPRLRTFSVIEYLIRKRLMKEKRGINIEETFDEILDSILNEAKPIK